VTPLPAVDPDAVTEFWSRCIAAGVVAADAPVPGAVEHFGDSVEVAEELIELVLHGPKRATAAAVAEFEQAGEPLPEVGGLWIACDGRGRPRALLRTTDVRVGPLSSVDDAFAWDEGEGDRTRASWLADHHAYFRRALPAVGLEFSPDLSTVFERFEVTYRG
jgi:uncharacterized protein YhfF